MNSLENPQILPLGNVRLFRRIRKNDTLFLKSCVFREPLVNVCIFRGNLVNYWETLQILPMGNVHHFRRIHNTDTPFLNTEQRSAPILIVKFSEKRTNSLNVHEKRTFSEKGVIFQNSAKMAHVSQG